jgi:hypothetical protein
MTLHLQGSMDDGAASETARAMLSSPEASEVEGRVVGEDQDIRNQRHRLASMLRYGLLGAPARSIW